jgi:hypothetical protein
MAKRNRINNTIQNTSQKTKAWATPVTKHIILESKSEICKWYKHIQNCAMVIVFLSMLLLNAKFLYQFQIQDFNLIKWHLVYSLFISKKCLFIGEPRNHGEVYSIQHYVIKFVSDLWQVGGLNPGTPVSPTNKTDCHDIAELLLKVVLNTTNQTYLLENCVTLSRKLRPEYILYST